MAGSYRHVTDERGRLRDWRSLRDTIDNLGDAYEALEEMYGMIWYLTHGDPARVEEARRHHFIGMGWSPGRAAEGLDGEHGEHA